MTKVQVTDQVSLSVPEGFHIMDEDEIKTTFPNQTCLPMWVMKDPERHIMVTLSWKKAMMLAAMLVGAKDMAVKLKKQYVKRTRGLAYNYQINEVRPISIGHEEGYGFDMTYEVQGIHTCAETACVKHKSFFCYVSVYYRESMKEESLKTIQEIYQSFEF